MYILTIILENMAVVQQFHYSSSSCLCELCSLKFLHTTVFVELGEAFFGFITTEIVGEREFKAFREDLTEDVRSEILTYLCIIVAVHMISTHITFPAMVKFQCVEMRESLYGTSGTYGRDILQSFCINCCQIKRCSNEAETTQKKG